MHIRFRKTLSILPGVRLNISRHGISTSVGARGAHLTFNRYGVRQSVGLPGTGLSETGYLMGGHGGGHEGSHRGEHEGGNRGERDEAARYHSSIHHGEGLGCALPGFGCLLLVLLIVGVAVVFGADALKLHPATFVTTSVGPLWHSFDKWLIAMSRG